MGRRAVRRIDPSLDLSRHLVPLEALPAPLEPAALFERPGPLEVDVGCGKGLFLLNAALAHPERNWLGVELGHRYAQYSAARLAKRGLGNARVVSGDALRLFAHWMADAALAAVHVYFPDPWWKARHKKRRVMKPEFLRHIERTLQPGGRLHFWTDVQEYFHETLELLRAHTALQGPIPVAQREAHGDLDYHTNFERKKRQAGLPIYRAEFVRPEAHDRRDDAGARHAAT
jgi:tRNA (guanine-N7-)-methyltransferase